MNAAVGRFSWLSN